MISTEGDKYNFKNSYDLLPAFAMNKPFKVDIKYKFNWHKSWTLPNITVSFNPHQLIQNYHITSKNLYTKISACIITQNTGCFEDVGLDGRNKELSLVNGVATFKNLKFRQTSKKYNTKKTIKKNFSNAI
jgi:hypothetical protein